jgi:hypothetical protein
MISNCERSAIHGTPFVIEVIRDVNTGQYWWYVTFGPESEAFPPLLEATHSFSTKIDAWHAAYNCLSYEVRVWNSHISWRRRPRSVALEFIRRIGEALVTFAERYK